MTFSARGKTAIQREIRGAIGERKNEPSKTLPRGGDTKRA